MTRLVIPSLQPVQIEPVQKLLAQPKRLFETIDRENGPLAIVFQESIKNTAQSFQKVLDEYTVNGRLYGAHKAAGSRAAIHSLSGVAGIDVASPQELTNALEAGFLPEAMVATGPKTDAFLAQLIDQSITVSIDSYEELERLRCLLRPNTKLPVLVRLSRSLLNMPGITRTSRFGHDAPALRKSLDSLRNDSRLQLMGVSYHIDTTSLDEKQYAMRRAVDWLLELQNQGFDAYVLDIGGGFGTDYGLTSVQLNELVAHLKSMNKSADNTAGGDATWQHFSYGLTDGRGTLRGVDVPDGAVGAERLQSLLLRQDKDGATLAQLLEEHLIELWIEPGAALFCQAGAVAARVIETKQVDNETIVVVDAHRNQICFENNEAPSDPLVVARSADRQPGDAYIAGHLCIESDFMSYRKIHFNQLPQGGDVLLWTHTGSYRSHFSTSQAIGQPLPVQLTYVPAKNSYTLIGEDL